MNSQTAITKVFVYGTLKPGEFNYPIYCQGKTIAEIAAYTKGQLYHLPPGYPGMTVGNNKVEGYLLFFSDHKILGDLDYLENYRENRAAQLNDYNRQQVPVFSLSSESLGTAWCYLMSKNKVSLYRGRLLNSHSWHSRYS